MAVIQEGGKTYNVSEKDGTRFWYLNNKLHREEGAAIENSLTGGKSWWYNGEKVICSNQKEFEKIIGLKKEAETIKSYDIKIEAMVPCTISVRVNAKSPEEAAEKAKTTPPRNVQYKLPAKKDKRITVYQAGTILVKLVKNLMGS